MRQIKTPLGSIALQLDTTIDISMNNPLFSAAEDFSINLTVPRKPNEHIFGHRNRMASAGTNLTMDAQFLFYGREKINGEVELISADDEVYELLLKGSRSTFFYKYGDINLHDIDFGEQYFVPEIPYPTSEEFVTEMGYTLTLDRDWICFPVNVQDDYIRATNAWDFENSKFIFELNSFTPFNMFAPYLRLWNALYRLFTYYGYTVTDNWFTETLERKNIVIYRKEETFNSFLTICKFYPKWTISEFISEIENFFPISICIDGKSKTVRIVGDDTLLTDAAAGKLDDYVKGKVKIMFNETQNGYELKYDYPSDDSVKNDKDYADQVFSTPYPSITDFPAASKLADIPLHSLADGGYYKSVADGDAWKWERVGSVAMNVRSAPGEITRETKIFPAMNELAATTQDLSLLNPEGGTELTPVRLLVQAPVVKGDGLYDTGYYWVNNFRLMVYRGMDAPRRSAESSAWTCTHTLSYPMANFVVHKMNGDLWPGNVLELRWDTDLGLRGAESIAFQNGARKVAVTMIMSHIDLEKIDLTKVYLLQGQRVIIDELVVHYGRGSMVEIDATLMMSKHN